jgi:hypothetical protein
MGCQTRCQPRGFGSVQIPSILRKVSHKDKGGPLDIRGGSTVVYDAYDRKTSYHFGSDERLNKIEYFKGSDPYQLYSQQQLYWGKTGNLQSKTLTLSDQAQTFSKLNISSMERQVTYAYDEEGRRKEVTYDNQAGTCSTLTVYNPHGDPVATSDALGQTTFIKHF